MTKTTTDSFLNEVQKEGKATGEVKKMDLNEALDNLTNISNREQIEFYKNTPEIEWPTSTLAVFCQDCEKIVSPIVKKIRKRNKLTCGTCGSRKVARAEEDALKKFYRIEEKEQARNSRPPQKS